MLQTLARVCVGFVSDEELNQVESSIVQSDHFLPSDSSFLKQFNMTTWSCFAKVACLEIYQMIHIAIPVVFSNIGLAIMLLISTAFVGHLDSPMFMASAAVANSLCAITLFLATGIASALDSLVPQAMGAKALPSLVVYYWRCVLLVVLAAIPVCFVFLFSSPLFIIFGIEQEIAAKSAQYLQVLLLGIFPMFISRAMLRYLNTVNIVLRPVIIISLCCALLILTSWIFMFGLNLGYLGAPLSLSIVQWIMMLWLSYEVYKFHYDMCIDSSWSETLTLAIQFDGIREFLFLAIPGAAMVFLESFAFEGSTIIAAHINKYVLAAHAAAMNLAVALYMIPMSISIAVAVRVGFRIGQANAPLAKFSLLIGLSFGQILALMTSLCLTSLSLAGSNTLFTSDANVVAVLNRIIPLVAMYQIFDYYHTVLGGGIRAYGYQTVGAIATIVSLYIIALPLAYVLGVHTFLKASGIWVGLASGLICIGLCYTIVLCTANVEAIIAQVHHKYNPKNE